MSSLVEIVEMSMLTDINKLSLASNNIANASTNSFKRESLTGVPFDYYVSIENGEKIPRVYLSERNDNVRHTDLSQGGVKPTGNPLDLAIEGDGYFVVQAEGRTAYTRRGDFSLDEMGRLVTKQGYVVEGQSGELRITTSDPIIKNNGEIWEGNNQVGTLSMVHIDESQLGSVQKDQYGNIKAEGLKVEALDHRRVLQGYVEASNVKSADEMINTIETLRHFELNQKLIHMQQEMFSSSIDVLGSF